MADYKITLLKGDGIGPEIVNQAVKVLDCAAEKFGFGVTYDEALLGGCAIDATGIPLPDETVAKCKASDSVLLGAVGGPKWDSQPGNNRPEAGLLGIRGALGLFANLRPSVIFGPLKSASPIKDEIIGGNLDVMIVRELTGGIYFGEKGTREGARGREGYDVECYSEFEVERVARHAFRLAQGRRKSVTSIDKSNALESSRLWRETVARVAQDYPDVQLTNLLVDKAAMELTCNPSRFDVMLTTSIFGDILSDEAGVATGSVGMLASAAINENGFGLFEPIHGTAPDIAGLGIANPLAAIASVGMLLEIGLGLKEEAAAIDRAINEVLHLGYRTPDIYLEGRGLTKVTTEEMGRLTAEHIHR